MKIFLQFDSKCKIGKLESKVNCLNHRKILLFLFYFSDAYSSTLSALYAKFLVVLGVAFPVTDILSPAAPTAFFQTFYLYLYTVSMLFVLFIYVVHIRQKAVLKKCEFQFKVIQRCLK